MRHHILGMFVSCRGPSRELPRKWNGRHSLKPTCIWEGGSSLTHCTVTLKEFLGSKQSLGPIIQKFNIDRTVKGERDWDE